MKLTKKSGKIISMLIVLIMMLPLILACGDKPAAGSAKPAESTAGTTASPETTTAAPTTTPPTTTAKPTDPPTEPPTDPANLPAPDIIGKTDTNPGYEIIPGARYYLWSPNSNLYLTADGDYDYAGLSQDDYTGKANQMFVFEKIREDVSADGTKVTNVYRIRSLGTKERYLDTEEAIGNEDGKLVLLTTLAKPEGEGSQEFTLKAQKKTSQKDADNKVIDDFANVDLPLFSVMNVISKNTKAVDVSGVSTTAGAFVHMWSGGTANNQKWFFERVSDVESGKIIPRGLQKDVPPR